MTRPRSGPLFHFETDAMTQENRALTRKNMSSLLPQGGADLISHAANNVKATLRRAEGSIVPVSDHLANTGLDKHAEMLTRAIARLHLASDQLDAMLKAVETMKLNEEEE